MSVPSPGPWTVWRIGDVLSGLLSDSEVMVMLGVKSKATLATWRYRKQLPYVRLGGRTIRYRRADIEAMIDKNTQGVG